MRLLYPIGFLFIIILTSLTLCNQNKAYEPLKIINEYNTENINYKHFVFKKTIEIEGVEYSYKTDEEMTKLLNVTVYGNKHKIILAESVNIIGVPIKIAIII